MHEHNNKIAALSQKAYQKKRPPGFISFSSYLPYGKYKGTKANIVAQANPHYLLEFFFPKTKLTIDPAFRNYVHQLFNQSK